MRKTISFLLGLLISINIHAIVSLSLTVSAGGLHSSLTVEQRNTITDLTLSGTIDARDFKTMRDEMPVLSTVLLNSASVVAYTGKDGTLSPASTSSYTYPANELPMYSFYDESKPAGKITLTYLTLPSAITSIGKDAFEGCTGISVLTIPSSVTTIGSWSFAFCGNSLAITIPASVTSINNFAFEGYNGTITVSESNMNYSSNNGVLFDRSQKTLIQCPVSKTGYYSIPSTVTIIGMNAFSHCKGFTGSFRIPSGVKTIGSWAFRDCSELKGSLIIPSSVDSIGDGAFYNCSGLTSIYTYSVTPVDLSFTSNVFLFIDKAKCKLYVPFASKSAYQVANQWMAFTAIEEMSASCVPISQFPYKQDFSSGSLPYCWSINDNEGKGQVWQFGTITASTPFYNPTLTGNYAYLNSDNYGGDNSQNSELISVGFDFTYYTTIIVGFSHYYRQWLSSASFSYSTDNGSTWNELSKWTTLSTNNPEDYSINLTNKLAGKSHVLFKWKYIGGNSWYWAIDDFTVKADKIGVSEYLDVMDTSINNSKPACFNATNSIGIAGGGSIVEIESGSSVNFIAGQSIHFYDGFHALEGCNMNASITTDGSFCFESGKSYVDNIPEEKSVDNIENTPVMNGIAGSKTIKVYPNPNNGSFTIESTNIGSITEVKVVNSLGITVYHTSSVEGIQGKVNLQGLNKGLYIVKVSGGEEHFTKKILVE